MYKPLPTTSRTSRRNSAAVTSPDGTSSSWSWIQRALIISAIVATYFLISGFALQRSASSRNEFDMLSTPEQTLIPSGAPEATLSSSAAILPSSAGQNFADESTQEPSGSKYSDEYHPSQMPTVTANPMPPVSAELLQAFKQRNEIMVIRSTEELTAWVDANYDEFCTAGSWDDERCVIARHKLLSKSVRVFVKGLTVLVPPPPADELGNAQIQPSQNDYLWNSTVPKNSAAICQGGVNRSQLMAFVLRSVFNETVKFIHGTANGFRTNRGTKVSTFLEVSPESKVLSGLDVLHNVTFPTDRYERLCEREAYATCSFEPVKQRYMCLKNPVLDQCVANAYANDRTSLMIWSIGGSFPALMGDVATFPMSEGSVIVFMPIADLVYTGKCKTPEEGYRVTAQYFKSVASYLLPQN